LKGTGETGHAEKVYCPESANFQVSEKYFGPRSPISRFPLKQRVEKVAKVRATIERGIHYLRAARDGGLALSKCQKCA
jgi:hypothetical protein